VRGKPCTFSTDLELGSLWSPSLFSAQHWAAGYRLLTSPSARWKC